MGHSSCLPPNNISQHTMKVLAIITFVALGALVNGQDDAVGVIDCDAVGIVAAALAGTMDLAETAKAYNVTEADVTDYDLRKAIVDKVTELGFKPEDAMQAVIDQCADYLMDIIDAVNDAADYQDLADAADYQDLADAADYQDLAD